MPTSLIAAAGPHFNATALSHDHFVDYALQQPGPREPDPIGPVSHHDTIGNPLALGGFNPANIRSALLDAVALNPQPLPPGETVSVNPQPLPPGDRQSINPQPLPPGGSLRLRADEEFCVVGKPRPPLPLQIAAQLAEQLGVR